LASVYLLARLVVWFLVFTHDSRTKRGFCVIGSAVLLLFLHSSNVCQFITQRYFTHFSFIVAS